MGGIAWTPVLVCSLAAYGSFAVWSLILSVADARTRRLPNRAVLGATATTAPLLVVGALAAWAWGPEPVLAAARTGPAVLAETLGGGAACGVAAVAVWWWGRSGVGGGDAKLAPLVGAVLGYAGGVLGVLIGIAVACGCAALWALVERIRGGARPASAPFAPCLCAGAWLVILLR